MKRYIEANRRTSEAKLIYSQLGFRCPDLRSMSGVGLDPKEALMDAIDSIDFPYLNLDWEDPDSFTFEELLEKIEHFNENKDGYDYIFYLSIDGKVYIDFVEEAVKKGNCF